MSFSIRYLEDLVSTTASLSLKSPDFGDSESINLGGIVRQSRGGSQLGVIDSSWPKIQEFVFSFSGLTKVEIEDLIEFINDYAGELLEITNYDSTAYKGIISNESVVENVIIDDCEYQISFTFQVDSQANDYYNILSETDVILTDELDEILVEETQ